jgi:hypothetical protein
MRSLLIGFLVFIAPATGTAAKPSIVLTHVENGLEGQAEFVCSGKIHGYLRLPERAVGSHLLEGIWKGPGGRVFQHSRIPVNFDPPGRSTAYLWLAFPAGSSFGRADPALDQERLSYNGAWHLDVRWDQKPLLRSTFTVYCQ